MLDGSDPADVTVQSSSNAPGDEPSDSQKPEGWSPSNSDDNPTLIYKLNDEDDTSELYTISLDEDNVESVTITVLQDDTPVDTFTVSGLSQSSNYKIIHMSKHLLLVPGPNYRTTK